MRYLNPAKSCRVTVAGFILHNICVRMNDNIEEVVVIPDDAVQRVEEDNPNAQEIRDRVARYVHRNR